LAATPVRINSLNAAPLSLLPVASYRASSVPADDCRVGYLAKAFATLVLPQYAELVSQIAGPLAFGELPIIFWLLICGAKTAAP